MILGRGITLPDDCPEEGEISDNWKKRQIYKYKWKEATWKRWVHEYEKRRGEEWWKGEE